MHKFMLEPVEGVPIQAAGQLILTQADNGLSCFAAVVTCLLHLAFHASSACSKLLTTPPALRLGC